MGNKLVGRQGLHIYPFEPVEMILDPQSFFKQATKFDRPQAMMAIPASLAPVQQLLDAFQTSRRFVYRLRSLNTQDQKAVVTILHKT